jgi:hypothetical protein
MMTTATIQFNDSTALYECVTEYGTYTQVHVSGDYGLFQEETSERFNCLVCANGEAREVSDGDEYEIDGITYRATINGWAEVGVQVDSGN